MHYCVQVEEIIRTDVTWMCWPAEPEGIALVLEPPLAVVLPLVVLPLAELPLVDAPLVLPLPVAEASEPVTST